MPEQTFTASEISQMAAMVPTGWEVVRHDSYDGTVIAMLFGASASAEPYCISRTAKGISLAVNRDDRLVELGCSATVAQMMVAVTALIGVNPNAAPRQTQRQNRRVPDAPHGDVKVRQGGQRRRKRQCG